MSVFPRGNSVTWIPQWRRWQTGRGPCLLHASSIWHKHRKIIAIVNSSGVYSELGTCLQFYFKCTTILHCMDCSYHHLTFEGLRHRYPTCLRLYRKDQCQEHFISRLSLDWMLLITPRWQGFYPLSSTASSCICMKSRPSLPFQQTAFSSSWSIFFLLNCNK